MTPTRNRAAPNSQTLGAAPAASIAAALPTMVMVATRAEPKRRIMAPANRPSARAPIDHIAMATPSVPYEMPRLARISGTRGAKPPSTMPLVKKISATPSRARRRWGATAGTGDVGTTVTPWRRW
ncbi:hypothetical protein GCM10025876_05170 [Demequina litorisediminis]|uniref:Uncharacterized protein n=1 Tax=Demequina litorisediminis TaxID=1849022 RepID=A0ABQ6I8Z0_9MICO|nr:hypothetical protein GCM10025876_05170 [Demequina litorisediminis]